MYHIVVMSTRDVYDPFFDKEKETMGQVIQWFANVFGDEDNIIEIDNETDTIIQGRITNKHVPEFFTFTISKIDTD